MCYHSWECPTPIYHIKIPVNTFIEMLNTHTGITLTDTHTQSYTTSFVLLRTS